MPLADDFRRDRLFAGFEGLLASALILGPAVSFFGGDFPEPGDSAAEVSALLSANRTRYLIGIFCEVISLGVVLWFFAGLRRLFGSAVTAARLMFVSAVALSVLIWVEDSILAASARLAASGTDAEIVAATREVGLLIAWPSARVATVMLLGAAGVAIVRTRELPVAVAWLACVVAVPNAVYVTSVFFDEGVLAPASDVGEIAAPGLYYLWLFIASLMLIASSRKDRVSS